MKILVVQFSSLSEILLTAPVIRVLKSDLQHTVHYVTKKEYFNNLVASPYLDKIHLLEDSTTRLINELSKEKFDYIVDLQSNFQTRVIKAQLGTKSLSLKHLRFKHWLFVNFRLNLLPNVHKVERYMEVVKPLGAKMDSLGLDYFIPHKDEVEENWLPPTHANGYAVFAIGADHATNKLPVKRMIELCDRINKPIILLGGKEDIKSAKEVEKFFQPGSDKEEKAIEDLNKKTVIFNACGKFSINQSASVISKANWVFTHDNTMMHIAAAFKKPIYSVWGNTTPNFGRYPYRTQFTIFENNKLKCRPCSTTGFEKCPKGHFKCMNELVFDFYLPD
ncbi:MAG: glycosyltransferase family 9 protein [Cyclobacteriaceae bacterium]